MRSSETSGLIVRNSRQEFFQGSLQRFSSVLMLAAIVLGIGLVVSTSAARAGDDDGDDRSFEEKIMDNVMNSLGAKGGMQKPDIEYRERSPLVVPPKLDLPPPASSAEAKAAPNWPKDPDEKRRKEAAAARKKAGNKPTPWEAAQPLSPSELNAGRTAAPARDNNDPIQPGIAANPSLSPSQLGYSGGFFGMFKGSSSESKTFSSEPPRESLIEPPPGYQTPSPNYAYGTGPDKSRQTYFDIMSGKEKQ